MLVGGGSDGRTGGCWAGGGTMGILGGGPCERCSSGGCPIIGGRS